MWVLHFIIIIIIIIIIINNEYYYAGAITKLCYMTALQSLKSHSYHKSHDSEYITYQ